jgi:hypothetical protein
MSPEFARAFVVAFLYLGIVWLVILAIFAHLDRDHGQG